MISQLQMVFFIYFTDVWYEIYMLKSKAQNSVIFSAIDYFTGQTAELVKLGVPVHNRT